MSHFKRSIKTVTLTPLGVFPLEKKKVLSVDRNNGHGQERCERSRVARESTVVSPGTFCVKQNAMKKVFFVMNSLFPSAAAGVPHLCRGPICTTPNPDFINTLTFKIYELAAKGSVTECFGTSN